jgi:site-specific DNA recombinase
MLALCGILAITGSRPNRELNRLSAQAGQASAQQRDELAGIDRQIRAIVEAIKDGMRTPAMKDELLALESRKAELSAAVVTTPVSAVRLHPNLAEIYRGKVARLHE